MTYLKWWKLKSTNKNTLPSKVMVEFKGDNEFTNKQMFKSVLALRNGKETSLSRKEKSQLEK